MLRSLIVVVLSLVFLKDQCALILSSLVVLILLLIINYFLNLKIVLYLVFVLVILRGVIVVYVYFSSLSSYIILKFDSLFIYSFIFFFYFFFVGDRFSLVFNFYYINNVHLTVFILLAYLLLILFIVVKLLNVSQFSLRRK